MNGNQKTYEAMFLLDSGNPDFQSASEPLRAILARNEAEVLALKLWDERKLTYTIRGRKRGLYVLSYFRADPAKIVEIERDCRLSEQILRTLILHREQLTEVEINAETPGTVVPRRAPEPAPGATPAVAPAPGAAPAPGPAVVPAAGPAPAAEIKEPEPKPPAQEPQPS